MYERIITDTNRTNRESQVYEAVRTYMNRHLGILGLPIQSSYCETEPFNTVYGFLEAVRIDKAVTVWYKHFEQLHHYLTSHEYGLWRAVHDVYGHGETWKLTKGESGNFNFMGEVESLFAVAKDTQSVLVVEGAILETVQRNLQPEVEFYPFTNETTLSFAKELVEMTR